MCQKHICAALVVAVKITIQHFSKKFPAHSTNHAPEICWGLTKYISIHYPIHPLAITKLCVCCRNENVLCMCVWELKYTKASREDFDLMYFALQAIYIPFCLQTK